MGGEVVGDYNKRQTDDCLHLDNGCSGNFTHHRACSHKPILLWLGSMANVLAAVLRVLAVDDSSSISAAGSVACPQRKVRN